MSDIQTLVFTSALTIAGGVLVTVIGQILIKFLIEPIYSQRLVVGEIADALAYHANDFIVAQDRPIEDFSEVALRLRRLASQLMARTVAIPAYKVLGFVRLIRPFSQIQQARWALRSLASQIHTGTAEDKWRSARTIATALRLAPIDDYASDEDDGPIAKFKESLRAFDGRGDR